MGIEDDDSSIESASTHGKNTPAHLSIEIGETANLADLTVNALDCSSLYMGSAADGGSSSRSHRSSPARLATPSSHSASSRGSGKRSLGVFPRTKPSTSAVEARPVTPNKKGTNLCTPYGLKRTAAPAAAAGSITTPSYNDGALGHRKRGEDEVGVLPSDAGAPTEVMTNRTTDIMTRLRQNMIDRGEERSEHPQQRGQQQLQWGGVSARKSMFEVDGGVPPPPPSVKRKGWLPGENGVGDAASATRAKASPSKTRLTSVGSTATTALHSLNQIDCNHSSQIEKDYKHDDGILPSLLDSHSTASYSLNETEVKTRGGSGGPRLSISAHARTPLAWNAASRESGIRRDGFAPAPIPQSTRLSKHVQKARQQSILSPSASETTASLHSINGVSSVNVEPSLQSGPLGDRDVTQSQPRGSTSNSLLPGPSNMVAGGGLRPVVAGGSRANALSAHYRRTKLNIRGAQQAQQVSGHASPIATPSPATAQAGRSSKRPNTPDPIIGLGEDSHYEDESCGEESTLPEYNKNPERHRAEDFIIYNQRPKQNAGAVFQPKGSLAAKPEEGNKKAQDQEPENGAERSSHQIYNHRYQSSGGEKSPIQPLFSLDRLDISVDSPRSPIRRARSRSMTPVDTVRSAIGPVGQSEDSRPAATRCSNSRSLSRETKVSHGLSSDRNDGRNATRPLIHLNAPQIRGDFDDENSILEEELVHIMEKSEETAGRSQHVQHQRRPRSAPSYHASRAKTPSSSGRSKSPSSSHSRSNHTEIYHGNRQQREVVSRPSSANDFTNTAAPGSASSRNESVLESKSIKEMIRTFNLRSHAEWKKSPDLGSSSRGASISHGKFSASAHARVPETKLAGFHAIRRYKGRLEDEEKKEDSTRQRHSIYSPDRDDDSSVKSLRDKLERKVEHHQKNADRDIVEDNDDDYSVQSLREKYEQKSIQQLHDDSADDDDRSVRSLREIFESPSKPKGEHVNSLRAKFETVGPANRNFQSALKKRNPMDKMIHPVVVQIASVPKPQIASFELPKRISLEERSSNLSTQKPLAFVDEAVTAKEVYTPPSTADFQQTTAIVDADDAAAILGVYRARSKNRITQDADRSADISQWKSDAKNAADGSNGRDRIAESAENAKSSGEKVIPQAYVTINPRPHVGYSGESNRGSVAQEAPLNSAPTAGFTQPRRNEDGSLRKTPVFHSIHSRLNQWANRRQIEKNPALASQAREDSEEELMRFNDIERIGSYDMTPVAEEQTRTTLPVHNPAYGIPTNSEIVDGEDKQGEENRKTIFRAENNDDSKSEDEKERVPGSHWTTKGTLSGHGKMLQEDDRKGASTDSEYSEAVTLDASIAEVSLLTNPSAIRSKESKDSKDDRQSDTSSSVAEKKSEASSSQPSEAAAPLISNSMHLRSDEFSSDAKRGAISSSIEAANIKSSYGDRQNGNENGNMFSLKLGDSAMATVDSQEHQRNWGESQFRIPFPFKAEPPDDHFDMKQGEEEHLFADSNWPDFGDENAWSSGYTKDSIKMGQQHDMQHYGNASRHNVDHGPNPTHEMKPAKEEGCYATNNVEEGGLRREIPIGPMSLETPTRPVQTPSRKASKRFDEQTLPECTATSSREGNRPAAVSPNQMVHRLPATTLTHDHNMTPTRGTVSLRRSTPDSRASASPGSPSEYLKELTPSNPKSPHRPRASDYEPRTDYGPSRAERLNRIQACHKAIVGPAPPIIKPPAVPPLPSSLDPDYAAIMESRHKMLLSRQRALLHRRAVRENLEPQQQSGFFVRTHPERLHETSENPVPSLLSAIPTRNPVREPVPTPSAAPAIPERTSTLHAQYFTDSDQDQARDAFGIDDAFSQKTFEALTRPSRRPREPEGSRWPSFSSKNTGERTQRNGEEHPSFISKVKSRLGMKRETREISQSEAVVARITAVRAARMRRSLGYGERDPARLSYREIQMMGHSNTGKTAAQLDTSVEDSVSNSIPGYRFYTHDDLKESVQTDDFSFSSNSNAQDYAATLAVD